MEEKSLSVFVEIVIGVSTASEEAKGMYAGRGVGMSLVGSVIEEDIAPRLARFSLDPGDGLLVVTDGIVEQVSGRGEP